MSRVHAAHLPPPPPSPPSPQLPALNATTTLKKLVVLKPNAAMLEAKPNVTTAIASLRATKNMTLGGSAFVLQPAPVGGVSSQPTGDILCLVNGDGIVAGIASANGNHACATAADAASVVTIPVGSGFISGLWIGIAKSGPPSIGKLVFEVTPPGGGPLDAIKYKCGTAGWPAAPLFSSIELFSAGDITTGCSNTGGASGRRLSQSTRVLDASRLTVVATPAPQAGEARTSLALNSVPMAGVLTPDQLAQVEAANADTQRITVTVDPGTPTAGTPTVGTPDSSTGVVSGVAVFTDTAGRAVSYSSQATSTGGGAVSVNAATGAFVYTPTQAQRQAAGGSTTDTFTVTANNGVRTATQTITVTVQPVASPQLDVSQTSVTAGFALGDASQTVYQTFTAGRTGSLTSVVFYQNGQFSGSSTIKIFAGAGLGGSLLATTTLYWVTTGDVSATFSSPPSLQQGSVYTINMVNDNVNQFSGTGASNNNPYSGGYLVTTFNGWTAGSGFDMYFKTYMQ
jgi:VCBS repeat-containing protein